MYALENPPFSTGFQRSKRSSFRSRIPVLARTTTSSRGGARSTKTAHNSLPPYTDVRMSAV
ncbi:hypothetical protein ANANG_G00211050 [Anguilla anguilla]|uniref:Uncharacterized protein n=1 Tax=Anguilla anguilla TaxID=7936 RepID=A0A9D3RUG0_ANGAN|nr:hypothetical protein ANANG_G00211050 [Anguilla anguilla]